jgi:sec-independent protein translocase protein TatA
MIVLVVVLLLFGSGKISGLMGDFAKGIKSFKNNMKEDEPDASMAAEAHPTQAGNITGPTTVPPTQAAPQHTTNRPAA